MAQLIVRNIEDEVKDRLAERARLHGHSMEQEVRTILRNAVNADHRALNEIDMGTRLSAFFARHGFDDHEIEELKDEQARPAVFD
ncbi:MAG: plasmid stabilization protein [Hyphomicrobiales bacterium]|nr:plasmid stabilization protein [Hyphomicrobiales bacterium]